MTSKTSVQTKFVSAGHYEMTSFTNPEKIYDIKYDYYKKTWYCKCPDATKGKNKNCKHLQHFNALILQKKMQDEIAKAETAISETLEEKLSKANERIDSLMLEMRLMSEELSLYKSSVYDLSKLVTQQNDQRAEISAALAQLVTSQKVVIQMVAPRTTAKEKDDKQHVIEEIRDNNVLKFCIVDKQHKVIILKGGTKEQFVAGCNCPTGTDRGNCTHEGIVEKHLSAKK